MVSHANKVRSAALAEQLFWKMFEHLGNLSEIVVGDRVYLELLHLTETGQRGVCWVAREKENLRFEVIEKRDCAGNSGILRDEIIMLNKGVPARRVVANVEVDGQEREMT